jgi:release factor glutamine methyltransferase
LIEAAADTLGSMLDEAVLGLAAAGVDAPRRQARRLISAALSLSPTELLSRPERALRAHETARIRVCLTRMTRGEPLSRIVGRREFWGLEFFLSPDTLDPRPDSETVVDAVLRYYPQCAARLRFLDLGTGTGCLLLALLSERRGAFGIGVDVIPGAVAAARCNAMALGLARRAQFFVGDWATAIRGRFDVVVANPPYVATAAIAELPREVALYDPRQALNGGEDGLTAYRAIAPHLSRLLAPHGIFAGEVGVGQANAVVALLRAEGLAVSSIVRDLAGIQRCVVACNRDDRRAE